MRECHRVLRPGGRLAAAAIEPAGGLSPERRRLAVEVGPSHVSGEDSIVRFATEAGFEILETQDVSQEFLAVAKDAARALLDARERLTADEDEETWEGEVDRKTRMVRGVEEGLLVRTLVIAERV